MVRINPRINEAVRDWARDNLEKTLHEHKDTGKMTRDADDKTSCNLYETEKFQTGAKRT